MNSFKLVSKVGVSFTGPFRVGPTKPVVLVLTPSMDFERKLASSTYTAGARYSGMDLSPLFSSGDGSRGRHASGNSNAATSSRPVARRNGTAARGNPSRRASKRSGSGTNGAAE